MPPALPNRPIDATLSVTKAARLLGVHPNTIRAWSDAGRLRYYRINPRGDRRYRLSDLQRFLAAAESGLPEGAAEGPPPRRGHNRPRLELLPPVGRGGREPARLPAQVPPAQPSGPALAADAAGAAAREDADLGLLVALARIAGSGATIPLALSEAATAIRDHGPHRAVALFELREGWLHPIASSGRGSTRLVELPRDFGVIGDALTAFEARDAAPATRRPGDLSLVDEPGRTLPRPQAVTSDDVRSVIGGRPETAVAIPGTSGAWGVLVIDAGPAADRAALDPGLLGHVAESLGAVVLAARQSEEVRH